MKTRVHGIRWYEINPLAIHHMTYNKVSQQLALARSDHSIEIWSFTPQSIYMDRVIQADHRRSIEALVWCRGRLFSIGLTGLLIEYDLVQLKEKNSLTTSFGGCWSMVPNEDQTRLAVGTEDGYVSIFKVTDAEVNYKRSFEKQEGRIICLSWNASGKYIATGSVNSLRVWNAKTGRSLQKMNVRTGNSDVVVLCVVMTSDLQVISGDSSGKVSFWDGLKGLLLQSIQSHKAEILCLDLIETDGKQACYASGVDPQILVFQRNLCPNRAEWIKGASRRIHSHDVRCLLHVDEYLISGGVDSYLTLSKYPPCVSLRFPPILPSSYLQVASAINCVLLQYTSRLDLWRLGNTNQDSEENYKSLPLSANPLRLLSLTVKENETVVCSTISCDGRWLAFSTDTTLKLYNLHLKNLSSERPGMSAEKAKFPINMLCSAVVLKFVSDANRLVSLSHSGTLQIIQADVNNTSLLFEFKNDNQSSSGSHLLSVSCDGCLAAVGDHDGYVTIYDLENYTVWHTLPKWNSQATALEFVPNTHFLLIAFQNRCVLEFDATHNRFSKTFEKLSLGKPLEAPYCCIRGIAFMPEEHNSFFLYDDANVYYVNRKELSQNKSTDMGDSKLNAQAGVQICSIYKHLLHFVHVQSDYVIALQLPPLSLQKRLPPKLAQQQFGT